MNRRLVIGIAAVGLAAQFGTLAAMIARRELALQRGAVCRFRTAPVDPYDAFRGRYVALALAAARDGVLCGRQFARGQRVHARVGADTNGFSTIARLAPYPDDDGVWIRTRVRSCYEDWREVPVVTNRATGGQASFRVPTGRYRVHLDLPLDRYYMEERLAPEAEHAYREASLAGKGEGVAIVRVWRGFAVLADVEVDGVPIREAARARLGK